MRAVARAVDRAVARAFGGTAASAEPALAWTRLTGADMVSLTAVHDPSSVLTGDLTYSSPNFTVPIQDVGAQVDGVTEMGKYRCDPAGLTGYGTQTGTGPRLLALRITPKEAPASNRPLVGLALVDSDGDGTGVGAGIAGGSSSTWAPAAFGATSESAPGSAAFASSPVFYGLTLVVGDDGIPHAGSGGTVAGGTVAGAWGFIPGTGAIANVATTVLSANLTGGVYLDVIGGWNGVGGTSPQPIDVEFEYAFVPSEIESGTWTAFTTADIEPADSGALYQNPSISGSPMVSSWSYDGTNGWQFALNADNAAGSTGRDGPDGGAYVRLRLPSAWRGDGTQALLLRCRPVSSSANSILCGMCLCDTDGVATAGVSVGSGVGWYQSSTGVIASAAGKVNDFDAAGGSRNLADSPVVYGVIPIAGPVGDHTASGTNPGISVGAWVWQVSSAGRTAPGQKADGGNSMVDGVYVLGFVGQMASVSGTPSIASHWEWRLIDVLPSGEYA